MNGAYYGCDGSGSDAAHSKHSVALREETMVSNRGETMKTMTCKQLGGACDETFSAATFEEIAEMSKKHVMVMFQEGDEGHLKAMNQMRTLMQDPIAMHKWFEERKREFETLPDE